MRVGDGAPRVTGAHGEDGGLRLATKPGSAPRREAPEAGRAAPAEATAPSPFGQLVRSLGREVDRGEATVKKVLHPGGADMGPSELLALQAGIYRYSEAVDLSAKLVDRATSGLKTVLSGQG